MTPTGFPHSEISGSTLACNSPELIAANHVLHRLLTPRHSPCARSSLVTNLPWNPGRVPHLRRSLRLAKPAFARPLVLNPPLNGIHNTLVHRYFLYRDTPSTRSRHSKVLNARSPLTLDCFIRVLRTRTMYSRHAFASSFSILLSGNESRVS